MTGPGPENPVSRSVVMRSEQAPLAAMAETPFLQQVGFTPALVQRLKELNDILIVRAPVVSSVSIELVPGETPLINTHVEHEAGYRVFLESNGDRASLSIVSKTLVVHHLRLILEDVQKFMGENFPNKRSTLRFRSNQLEGRLEDLMVELDAMSSQDALTIANEDEDMSRSVGGLSIEGNKNLMVFDFDNRTFIGAKTSQDRDVLFQLREFNFKGRPEEVEEMLMKVVSLFNKPRGYPTGPKEFPDVRTEEEKARDRESFERLISPEPKE